MSRDPTEREPGEAPERPRFETWIVSALEDSMLWPLWVVMALVFSTFFASVLLLALEGRLFAMVSLLALVWMSVDGVRRSRVPGGTGIVGRILIGLWALSALVAAAAHYGGFF